MNATLCVKKAGNLLLAAVAALVTTLPAEAQTNTPTQRRLSVSQPAQSYTVLHVNAVTGNDQQGAGSAEQPYKTITQALQAAPGTSTVILVAPGHYSQASGEQFPLRLRPGLTIQGNAGETRNTMIVGSGEFRDSNVTQNATIVTSDRSGLANISVSNPKGSGVWISAGSPVLRRVALVSNAVAGVQVTNGAPVIENSYFNRNRHGLAIQGNSRAIVRGNYFDATGRAITIASPATPTINNNRIARNDVGIALKNNARPVLEANVLNDNGRNGVVEVEPSAIALPAISENSDEDLLAVAETSSSVALGREEPAVLTGSEAGTEVAIKLSRDQQTELPALATPDMPAAGLEAEAAETSVEQEEEESAIAAFRQHLAASSAPASSVVSNPAEVMDSTLEPLSTEGGIPIAVVPVGETEATLENNQTQSSSDIRREGVSKLLARLNRQPAATTAAPVESHTTSHGDPPSEIATVSSQRLPVPAAAIPSGGGSGNLTPPGTVSLAKTFRYQVLVDMSDAEDLQTLVPDAFRTEVESRMYMQAGAYVDEADAQERLEWLQENGIDGRINLRE